MEERCVGNEMQYLIYLLLRDGLAGVSPHKGCGQSWANLLRPPWRTFVVEVDIP